MQISTLLLCPLLVASSLIAVNTAATPAPSCVAREYRQFDFWLGDWQVSTPDGKRAGTSRIERIADGCALLENWSGTGHVTGKSLNIYDIEDRHWHQFWVDSSGSRLALDGGFIDGKMILQADTPDAKNPGGTVTQRITWKANADGSVRQLWETSTDHGKTWTIAFDGKYSRAIKQ